MQGIFYFFVGLFVCLIVNGSMVAASEIYVYKNPYCGCCNKWIAYLKEQGYAVKSENNSMLPAMKEVIGVTPELTSCHTAVVDGYFLEGHVPAEDIKRLLDERPDIKGLAVPGMPIGAPGMEQGDTKERYDVIAVKKDGSTYVYSTHNN
jgi:hypothetical protein